MAKVKSPFLSVQARGNFAGILTAYSHSKRSYIMPRLKKSRFFSGVATGFGRMYFGSIFFAYTGYVSPTTKKQYQGSHRYLFKEVWNDYALLSPTEKQNLDNEAKYLNMTGANLYMSRWLKNNS